MALVIGGSGLLGSVIMRLLKCQGTHFSNPTGSTLQWDPAILKDYKVIINCAADKNVDHCEKNFERTKSLNSDLVDTIVKYMAADAHLIQISTDYVYGDNGCVDPKNIYGISKLLGEFKATHAARWTVLRVPALYFDPSDVIPMNLTRPELFLDTIPRYHTSCKDVAEVVYRIIKERLTGIWHFTANVARSKYQIANFLNLPFNVLPAEPDPIRPGHVYLGNDFNKVPRQMNIEPFQIPKGHDGIFMMLDLDGTLLDTVQIHRNCYEAANGDRTKKTALLKRHYDFDFKWNSDVLIDFIHRWNINHVVLTNTTMDVVDHFRKCVPKLRLLKNFVTKDQYENRKPNLEPYHVAMQYHRGEQIMVFDDLLENLAPMAPKTRKLFHMSDHVVDRSVFTLNDFARLVFVMGG